MKTKWSILMILVVVGIFALAACGGNATESETPVSELVETESVETEPVENEAVEAGEVVTLYVGPELADCTGAGPQTCMMVKDSPDGEYQFFYSQIEGFTFVEGFEYELKVQVTPVENPPADGSSLSYTLVEEVSKTPADATASTMPATDTQDAATLTGATWTLTAYAGGDGTMVDVLPDTEVTAVFGEDGSLSDSSGCNSYNTSYTVDGNNISISEQIAATMMMCPEPVMQQETAYLAGLTAATTYEISDDTLTLVDASGNPVAVFSVLQSTALTGVEWVVTSYNNGKEAVVSVINGTTITAVFSEDGMVSGNASCNIYNAPYELDGSNITIGVGMTTMMACPEEGIMEQETAYLAAITTAATYSIQGDTLELRTADGALAASYVAKEPTDLAAIPWLVTSYNNGRGGAVSPILGTELTLEFAADGNINGSAGCNRYFGPYTLSGDAIQIGPLSTTRALCPEPAGVMDQEQEFLAALQAAATYTLQNDTLDIRMADGAIAINAIPNTPLPAEIQGLVENATFKNVAGGGLNPITLSNGIYQELIPDSAASLYTSLLDTAAFGQIDGQPAAAVTLATNAGGTGTYIDLAVVTFADGAATNVATTLLGDRVQVNSVEISANGTIVVDMVEAGESDPLCCPTQHVINIYTLQNGELVKVSSTSA